MSVQNEPEMSGSSLFLQDLQPSFAVTRACDSWNKLKISVHSGTEVRTLRQSLTMTSVAFTLRREEKVTSLMYVCDLLPDSTMLQVNSATMKVTAKWFMTVTDQVILHATITKYMTETSFSIGRFWNYVVLLST